MCVKVKHLAYMAAEPNSRDHLPRGSNLIHQIAICPVTNQKSEQENFH